MRIALYLLQAVCCCFTFNYTFMAQKFYFTILQWTQETLFMHCTKDLTDTLPTLPQRYLKRRRSGCYLSAILCFCYSIRCTSMRITLGTFWCIFNLISVRANFKFFSCSIVNSVICLSFVQTYRRGLKNILCPCYRTSLCEFMRVYASLWTSTSSRSINTQKKNLANIQRSWPHTWSITHT